MLNWLTVFQKKYKLVALDLSKQEVPDAGPIAMQMINFNWDFDFTRNTTRFLIYDKTEETIFDFSQETVRVL